MAAVRQSPASCDVWAGRLKEDDNDVLRVINGGSTQRQLRPTAAHPDEVFLFGARLQVVVDTRHACEEA